MVTTTGSERRQIREVLNTRQALAGLLLLTIIVAFLVPHTFPVLTLLPLLAFWLVFALMKKSSTLPSLILEFWVAAMLIIAFAKWKLVAEQFSLTFAIISALIVTITAMLILLWHWRRRYHDMLEQHDLLFTSNPEVELSSVVLPEPSTDVEVDTSRQKTLLNQLEQRTQHLTLLNEIGQVLSDSPSLTKAQERISALAAQLFDTTAGALCVRNRDSKCIRTIATWGEVSMETQFFQDECWALRHGETHLFSALEETGTAFCEHLHYTGMSEYLCIPLKVPGQTVGVLHLHALPGETLSAETQKLAEMAAEQIALVLANLTLRDSLRLKAIRDPLTRLYNREYMEESLNRELQKVSQSQLSMGIIMLDVDQLQEFNNLFGYEKGDELLRQLSLFLQSTIRGGDLACRYGEDEFALILPGASLEVTRQRAEQLRKGVRLLKVQQDECPAKQATLSLGVISFPEHGVSKKSLIYAAESALVRAKADGGSSVVVG